MRGLLPVAAARQQDGGSGPRSGGDNGVRKVTPAGAGSRPVRAGTRSPRSRRQARLILCGVGWLVIKKRCFLYPA